MIVYGDPQFVIEPGVLIEQVRARLHTLMHASTQGVDDLRALLIACGQLEQGVHDALAAHFSMGEADSRIAPYSTLTDNAADAFYHAWATAEHKPVKQALRNALHMLDQLTSGECEQITVKLPEGFAHYALYPEQYCMAALRWDAEHDAGPVAVVGIRSIGTTLSALVRAALRARGREVCRFTVRPTGHPFARECEIGPERVAGARWGLVVDEGPGLSGSSMAAVGSALCRAGLAREAISLLPGHGGEPGGAASEEVRAWWSGTSRYVVSPGDVLFGGRPLKEALARAASDLARPGDVPAHIEDIGGGLWRKRVYTEPGQWPPANVPFERPKYLCTLQSGERLLLKFEGLVVLPGGETLAAVVASISNERAQLGLAPAAPGTAHGFVISPWLEGTPLRREDACPEIVRHMGRYIAAVAGPDMSEDEHAQASARLANLLYWNTWEALGEVAAGQTRALAANIYREMPAPQRRYGDGRMAPHEWLRTGYGTLVKTDGAGHDWDHTAVGVQPVAWDLAGALVEWDLHAGQAALLLGAFREAGGEDISASALRFYRAAYAAFRAGQCHLCAAMCADAAEQERLTSAYGAYKEALQRALTEESAEVVEGVHA